VEVAGAARAPVLNFECGFLLQLEKDLANTSRGLLGSIRWRSRHHDWQSGRAKQSQHRRASMTSTNATKSKRKKGEASSPHCEASGQYLGDGEVTRK
jgi:hypothetical protein